MVGLPNTLGSAILHSTPRCAGMLFRQAKFTHSAADLQWLELARLICPDNPECSSSHNEAVSGNPAIADWFFYHQIQKFLKHSACVGVLGATDYCMHFEWQHHGSPHIHGLAWLSGAPDVEQIVANGTDTAKEELIRYVDKIITTLNPFE